MLPQQHYRRIRAGVQSYASCAERKMHEDRQWPRITCRNSKPNKKGRCFHRPFNGHGPCGPANLHQAELISGHFAGAAVSNQFKRDLLAFLQIVDAGALNSADMDERVCAAIVRLNEAEALL